MAAIAALIVLGGSTQAIAACTMPNVLTNGQVADASKVMDDLNAAASCADAATTPTGTPTTGSIAVFSSSKSIGSGDLTGDVTTSGSTATTLTASGVPAGTYVNPTITVDAKGRVTAAVDGAASGGGGLLGTYTGTAATQADIPLPAGYSELKLVIYMTFSTDATTFYGRVTTDNFATVKSGSTDYSSDAWRGNTNSAATTTTNAGPQMTLAYNVGGSTGDDMAGEIDVYFAGDPTKLTRLTKHLSYGIGGSTPSPSSEVGDGAYMTAATVNGIRLYPAAGTITYTVYVYGDPT